MTSAGKRLTITYQSVCQKKLDMDPGEKEGEFTVVHVHCT